MIAFGCAVSEPEAYRRYCEPGIRRVAEAGAEVYAFSAVSSISRSGNLLLDTAARIDDLEALVLLHPHAELTDPAFCAKVRKALRDDEVAVVGAAGARGVRSLAWWEGEVVAGALVQRYSEHGGGELSAFAWAGPRSPPPAEVDAIDAFVMVLSPWAVRNVRFDETLTLGPGFELDYCLQVRAAGRKIRVAELGLTYHQGLEIVADPDLWVEAHVRLAAKWPAKLNAASVPGASWERRARRAEAEREAERAIAYGHALHRDARVLALERRLEQVTHTPSWRLTEPLRRVNKALADRRS